ncbi:MAG: hypothetical protein GDA38_17745 [Hormoscilla sp. SP12CHS1]|nr:hypothetical protein [Hormoscilla sp. SP12CHS1]
MTGLLPNQPTAECSRSLSSHGAAWERATMGRETPRHRDECSQKSLRPPDRPCSDTLKAIAHCRERPWAIAP